MHFRYLNAFPHNIHARIFSRRIWEIRSVSYGCAHPVNHKIFCENFWRNGCNFGIRIGGRLLRSSNGLSVEPQKLPPTEVLLLINTFLRGVPKADRNL